MKSLAEKRPRSPQHPCKTSRRHGDRPGHHKAEAGIPASRTDPREIEKVENLCRIGHARDQQSESEDQADCKLKDDAHDAQPRCRATNTVAIPVAMNVRVATIERTESRDSPHTP